MIDPAVIATIAASAATQKQPEGAGDGHERLKATVRMFLDAIRWVPMRAVDCDQRLVDKLWRRLCKETEPSRKVGSPGRKVGRSGRKVGRSETRVAQR